MRDGDGQDRERKPPHSFLLLPKSVKAAWIKLHIFNPSGWLQAD
jgi:hypothetical protein